MHRPGWRRILPVLAAGMLTLLGGCGNDSEEARGQVPDAAAEASPDAGSGFGASPCMTCISTSCALQVAACRSKPQCAGYMGCLAGCPVSDSGNASPECEAGCSQFGDPEAIGAKEDLDACRVHGAGAQCAECGIGGPDGGYPGDPILDQQCGPSGATDPCDKCLMEHCCETEAACEDSAECGAMQACYGACSSATDFHACMRECYEANPAGAGLLASAGACLYTFCLVPGACEPALQGCLACSQEKCAETFSRCFADPECYLILHCVPECGNDVVCQQACIDAYSPEAGAKFDAYATCLVTRCAGCG